MVFFMELRYRQKAVEELVCNAAQDCLKMMLQQGWQNKMNKYAETAIEGKHKDKYIQAYNTMRDYGIENYSVDKMDITMIANVINFGYKYLQELSKISEKTKKAINLLREDKNDYVSHSSQNESPAEKYLQCIFMLCHLKRFVRTVDEKEICISEDKRIAYRQNYIPKIEELISKLDQDRFELIYEQKSIEYNVQKVLDSANRNKAFLEISKLYRIQCNCSKSISDSEHKRSVRLRNKFYIAASSAGICEAHDGAILFMLNDYRDYPTEEVIQHIKQIKPFTLDVARFTLGEITSILIIKPERHDELFPVVQAIREEGYEVEELENYHFSVKPID